MKQLLRSLAACIASAALFSALGCVDTDANTENLQVATCGETADDGCAAGCAVDEACFKDELHRAICLQKCDEPQDCSRGGSCAEVVGHTGGLCGVSKIQPCSATPVEGFYCDTFRESLCVDDKTLGTAFNTGKLCGFTQQRCTGACISTGGSAHCG